MKMFGIVFAAIAALCLVGIAFIAGQPPTVGADGVVAPVAISWVSLILSLFTGSTVASIAAFWKSVQPTVATITQTIAPGIPIPPADIIRQLETASELLQAVLAYSKNGDAASQRRMVLALMTELSTISETQSPEIATAVSTAMQAITAKWFPSVTEVVE
jgi:hypothetical protein